MGVYKPGAVNGKMTCLGKNRRVLAAWPFRWRRGGAANDFRHSLRGSFFLLAVWMALLACGGIGWAGSCTYRPCPKRAGWRAASWYQAGHGTLGNGGYGGALVRPVPPQRDREHLGQWLRQHQNMSFADQERALRTEPGFNRLPPARQQRLLGRLQQLDAMPPVRRERMLQRLETWERLSPEQRQQVRIGILEVHQMPFDRQRMIHRAVRDLSEFPPDQRGEILNSWEFRHRYSDYERQVLATLMLAQPYEPLRPQ
ncbi:MAG: DUF3106 domain-containing protein [Acidobacteriaceae bacterium]